MSMDYARIQDQDPSPFPSCLLRGESFTTYSFSGVHDILLVTILTCLSAFILCLVSLHLVTERDGREPLLYQCYSTMNTSATLEVSKLLMYLYRIFKYYISLNNDTVN
jgi:hypothetical protein